ncbi:uncharacterized protein SPSK_04694 [Sporothrix schenckii 1099-18]|uniref:Uncharacterized protein n=2 Tax=Sporothrix schenckii TaxID=29908 RepID=U7PW15_SPOS1|nr:uncharacterized protein SPSK_04694 [Sporothrix schenckii 1099-18]ERS99121.1 hypothetical protein HMPREF1624_04317 [Sporothrix schenckii ATCC 58251]KJR83221.1 hypothetical protein SPSK_04694 [Sporothrix schenckii 1099-18]
MPSQIFTPITVSPQRKDLQVVTSTEILASFAPTNGNGGHGEPTSSPSSTTTLSYNGVGNTVITTDVPRYAICEHDYTVPAAPPSSPVSFRNDHHWLPPSMVKNAHSPLRN